MLSFSCLTETNFRTDNNKSTLSCFVFILVLIARDFLICTLNITPIMSWFQWSTFPPLAPFSLASVALSALSSLKIMLGSRIFAHATEQCFSHFNVHTNHLAICFNADSISAGGQDPTFSSSSQVMLMLLVHATPYLARFF